MNSWGRHREVEKVKPPRQISVAQLPEHQQDAAMSQVDEAIEKFPSVMVAGHLLHVCQIDGHWQVWLNCEDAEFTGAVRVFEAVVEKLQEPVL
ncbi:MAG TPA: hypothetical protein VEU08_17210 [Vicinamibacterales bacterium]|nr:hypothetical protein [Vicinamibacterales bacterium]